MNTNKAFSLIELLIVITIVSIMAVIGHSAFLNYVMRAKVAEGLKILDEYQDAAIKQFDETGNIVPYYVLFTQVDDTGWVSGTTSSDSAVKELNLAYVNTVSAYTGTSGSDSYILLGVGLQDDGIIVSGADHLYLVGIISPAGELTWQCGISVSQGDTMVNEYLPQNCQNTIP